MSKKTQLEVPMMLMNLGGWGVNYIVSWGAGVQMLTLMRDAIKVESEYKDGKTLWKRAKGDTVKAEAFMPAQVAQVLMSGEPE